MINFKSFLQELKESKSAYEEICEILDMMTEDEVQDFGYWLEDEFFDEPSEDEIQEAFTVDSIKNMLGLLPENLYPYILRELDEEELDELGEGVSRIQKQSNVNRKKRKFMQKGKTTLRKEEAIRKRENRKNLASRKRYYRANKTKISGYQKSRAENIKKGKHKVKLRKQA